VRLALAQMNSVVGDLGGNRDGILELLAQSREPGADLVLFPELAVTGYPPEDLLLRPAFVRADDPKPAYPAPAEVRAAFLKLLDRPKVLFNVNIEETKRDVWPSRKETLQTTGIVFAFVAVMAIFLWLIDAGLLWAVRLLMGQSES